MEDTLIEYNTAVLAKEKGFNEPTINHWERGIDNAGWGLFNSPGFILKNDQLTSTYINEVNDEICGEFSAPTQSLLAKWLREEHGIHVTITSISQESWQCHITRVGETLGKLFFEDFYTFEEALEYGLQEALKLIK